MFQYNRFHWEFKFYLTRINLRKNKLKLKKIYKIFLQINKKKKQNMIKTMPVHRWRYEV